MSGEWVGESLGSLRANAMKGVKATLRRCRGRVRGRRGELSRFEDRAEKGTYPVQVVFGPEGCGKSALLRQAVEVLKEHEHSAVLVSPLASLEDRLVPTEELREVAESILSAILGRACGEADRPRRQLLYKAMRRGVKQKIALLLDDAFQAVESDKAALQARCREEAPLSLQDWLGPTSSPLLTRGVELLKNL